VVAADADEEDLETLEASADPIPEKMADPMADPMLIDTDVLLLFPN
jgi:hypothetical protein